MVELVLVTAYISNINRRTDRTEQWYLDHLRSLIASSDHITKVVFIESRFLPLMDNEKEKEKETKVGKKRTFWIPFEKQDLYFYQQGDMDWNVSVHTDAPQKDTLEYMLVQCHKSEWLRLASTLLTDNAFFLWVDCAIAYHFQGDLNRFRAAFTRLAERVPPFNNQIYAAQCQHPCIPSASFLDSTICWFFAGSVVGGRKAAIEWFADEMKRAIHIHIGQKKGMVWEINFWYGLWRQFPDRFVTYTCNHDASLLEHCFF
jgi:hypothetical protein